MTRSSDPIKDFKMKRIILICIILLLPAVIFAEYKEALLHYQKENYKKALDICAEDLVVEDDMKEGSPNYRIRFLAAHIHWKLGNGESCIAHLKRCMEIRPDKTAPHIDLGLYLLDAGRYEDAIVAARRGLTVKEDAMLYYVMATAYRHLGNYWRAKELYERTNQKNPEISLSYNGLGMALMELEKYSEANAAFSIAYALAPDNPAILNNLAVSYHKSGKPSRAKTSFQRALIMDPENKKIQSNMKELTGKK